MIPNGNNDFDISSISFNLSILIIGKRGCGKTFISKKIAEQFDNKIVVSSIDNNEYDDFTKMSVNEVLNNTEIDNSLIILDDCRDFKNTINLMENKKNKNVSFITIIQYPAKYNEEELKFDYIFIFNDPYIPFTNKLFQYYGNNNEEFKNTLSKCAENYECMIVDKTDDEDEYFYFKNN